jgi:hypothetical protein
LGADAWNVLLLVGIMLSAMGFFAEFVASNLNRRLRERMAEIDFSASMKALVQTRSG